MKTRVVKILTANDIGVSGSHQAGICVPRREEILSAFPTLDASHRNPRTQLNVQLPDRSRSWKLNYIYYNNRFFGGTRNEYRLTGTTSFIKETFAKVGDELVLERLGSTNYLIWLDRKSDHDFKFSPAGALILKGGWKVVNAR